MQFSWHCSCRFYFCCFPLALANIRPWLLVLFFEISLKNSELKITHNTFRDCRVHFFPTTFLKIALYNKYRALSTLRRSHPSPPPPKDGKKNGPFVLLCGFVSDWSWFGGLLFHSILSKIGVEITLRCMACEEKKIVSVNDLCALTQSKNRMIREFRVYWRNVWSQTLNALIAMTFA